MKPLVRRPTYVGDVVALASAPSGAGPHGPVHFSPPDAHSDC